MGARLGLFCGVMATALLLGGGFWFLSDTPHANSPRLDRPRADGPRPEGPHAAVPRADGAEAVPAALPVPPFPPRVTDDPGYEACLALLPDDPAAAMAMVRTWPPGNLAARHCQALARIAAGAVEEGAGLLETLSQAAGLTDRARAMLLDQAADAWFQAGHYEPVLRAIGAALALLPDDPDLLLRQATTAAALGRDRDAVASLSRALAASPDRVAALVARAIAWRRLDQPGPAGEDIARAATLAPDDPEVLLERGIQRQSRGDLSGARADWQRVVQLEPGSEAADLAEQNLTLLDTGPTTR